MGKKGISAKGLAVGVIPPVFSQLNQNQKSKLKCLQKGEGTFRRRLALSLHLSIQEVLNVSLDSALQFQEGQARNLHRLTLAHCLAKVAKAARVGHALNGCLPNTRIVP